MSSHTKRLLLLFFFATILFFGLRAIGKDLSLAQLAVLPFFIYILSQISFFGIKVHRSVLLAALVFGVTGVALSYNVERLSKGGVYVARFKDDPLESASRIFRTKLSNILEPLEAIEALRYPSAVDSLEQATNIIKEEKKDALVWGKSNWIHLTVNPGRNQPLREILPDADFKDLALPDIADFYFIQSANDLSLSLNNRTHTDVFLSYVLGGELFKEAELKKTYYSLAAGTKSFWSSNAHKAYPFWRLGNLHFLESFRTGNYQPAELACAIKSYQAALNYLNKYNSQMNIDLYRAILNNYSIALVIKSVFQGDENLKKLYLKGFLRAKQIKEESPDVTVEIPIRDAIKYNLKLLYKLGEHQSEKMDRRTVKKLGNKKIRKHK